MSLKVGGEGRSVWGPFCVVFERKKEESSALRECGKRGAFQGRWAAAGNRAKRPELERWRFSTAVHGPAFPQCSVAAASGAELGDACQQLALGALHIERGFGIGLVLGEALQFGQSDAGSKQTPAVGHLSEYSNGVAQRG